MKTLPRFDAEHAGNTDSIALAVYAPFGTDPTLSQYPGSTRRQVDQHPLVRALAKVAALGVHVHLLIDLVDDYSHVIEFDAGQTTPCVELSAWKQDMASPFALAGFLRHVRRRRPCAAIVLALEGHGAGYLPEIDRAQLTAERVTQGGAFEWKLGNDGSSPVLPTGSPILPTGSPILPTGSPILPAGPLPMSTPALGEALAMASDGGKTRLAVIHFNNCFNMAVELLDTVAPYAAFAAGYCNYNFFSAGQTYPATFRQWMMGRRHTPLELARAFAQANGQHLSRKGHHPTIGSVVALERMSSITSAVDRLARELTHELQTLGAAARKDFRDHVQDAIRDSQQYDTVPAPAHAPWTLDEPDQLTDLSSLAAALKRQFDQTTKTWLRADALQQALNDVKVYGATDSPWMDPNETWDFSSDDLGMSIFLPDPDLRGVWDWRSPFYLERQAPPNRPPIQPQVIRFLKQTQWIEFLIEYHRDVPFVGLLPALAPKFPVFKARFDPNAPPGKHPGPSQTGGPPSAPAGVPPAPPQRQTPPPPTTAP